jgi:hypothetical protein
MGCDGLSHDLISLPSPGLYDKVPFLHPMHSCAADDIQVPRLYAFYKTADEGTGGTGNNAGRPASGRRLRRR